MPERVDLYASVGPTLTHYDVDVDNATLTGRGSVDLPSNVHYVWPHAHRGYLYVASSNSASGIGGFVGDAHHVSALRIDDATGELTAHGEPIALPTRPIHMTSDIPSRHLLVAFSNPSGLKVYGVSPDATPGAEIVQREAIDPGIYAHQVRVSPDNRLAILVTRGHDAAAGKPEEPGALKVFRYEDGLLSDEVSIAPGGGYGFGPRHLDFHPTKPWVYVSLERQNGLDMFAIDSGRLSPSLCSAKQPWPIPPASAGGRSPAPSTSTRTAALFTWRTAPQARSVRERNASLPAARTRSRCSRSTPRAVSHARSSTSILMGFIAEPFTSIPAAGFWSRRISSDCRSEPMA